MISQTPHASDLRKGRRSLDNQIYHVTFCSRDRRPYFESFHVGRIIVSAIRVESDRRRAHTLAFVIMPDHVHWLMQLIADYPLRQTVLNIRSRSTKVVNNFLGRSGTIWQDGYHDRALRSDEDVIQVARYIIANPLRAGIVTDIGSYALWDADWI